MLDEFTLVDTTQCNTAQCYFTSDYPLISDCIKAYMKDNDTDMILKNIQKSKCVKWTAAQLKTISPGCNTALKEGRI